MLQQISKSLHLKPGEGPITALMLSHIFSALTFYYLLKPLGNAFIVSKLSSAKLPYAYILTALFAGTITTFIFKYGNHISVRSLLTGTNIVVIGTLMSFRWALGRDIPLLPYIWFVYLKIVPVLLVAQFWLLAGFVYDNRQAKRIYTLLGTGAIVGASTGSFIPAFLSGITIDTRMLLCVGIIGLITALAQLAWRSRRQEVDVARVERKYGEPSERLIDLIRLVFGSKHLLLLSLLLFLSLIASQIVDWQVNNALDVQYQDFPNEERLVVMDQYWARLYFWTNNLGIILQLILTNVVIRRLGIGATIFFLPIGVFVASFGVLLTPALLSTTLALGVNNTFRYSINRAGLELLYLPISTVARKKLKLFIDVFIDRLGRAFAALLILSFVSLKGTTIAVILVTAFSIAVCFQLRKAYVNAFRQQLAQREVDLSDAEKYLTDPDSVKLLVKALESDQDRQILYSLRLLHSVRGVDFTQQLLPLLEHPSIQVREAAVRTLYALPKLHQEHTEKLLADCQSVEDPLLRFHAVNALNHLYDSIPALPASGQSIAERVYSETRSYYEVLALYRSIATNSSDGKPSLLGKALQEKLDQNLESIFRLLSLQYPHKDIYSAYLALKGTRAALRTSAIELLDNLLQQSLKSIILPLLEEPSTDQLLEQASRHFGIHTVKYEEALRIILEQPDVWLKGCALHEVGTNCIKELEELCRELAKDEDALISQTAAWALKQCAWGDRDPDNH